MTDLAFRVTHKSTWLFRPHWRGTFSFQIFEVVLKNKNVVNEKREVGNP